MSLLWRERLVATLTPDSVLLRRTPPFWRRGRVEVSRLSCAGSEGAEVWRGPLAQLGSVLENVDLEVVLSSHFVRLQLLPWQAELRSPLEWQAYAGFRFQEVYGALADAWEIVFSAEPPGRPLLACGVDRSLLTALQELVRSRRCRLLSVQPAFALAWNRRRHALHGPASAFVLAEPGRLCAGLSRGGEWVALRNVVVGDCGLAGVLPTLLEQQALLADPPLQGGELLLLGLDGEPLKEIPALPVGWSLCPCLAGSGS